ncbi:hypothetical protein V494_01222 [Pseudogymnoascus sp. VKM F-4513 (FW-928)]|nr:hypothetical protein V494_01222 [Pseudogymnoascus sp. VKM F-4513 (FW-928)]
MWSKALCLMLFTVIACVAAQDDGIRNARDSLAQLIAELSSKVSLITDKVAENKKRQEDGSSASGSDSASASDAPNAMSQLVAALSSKASLTGTVPISTSMPTCLMNFDAPDPTLARAMLTALPGSVLGQLGNAGARSSIASAFKAGQTPSWYEDLSPEIKSYVLSVQTRATTGCTPRATDDGSGSSDSSGAPNAKVGGDKVVGTSTSEALASRPTAAIIGLSGALGMLGLMVAL